MSSKVANSLNIVLNLWSDLVVSYKGSAYWSFVVCLFVLTLAFSVVLVVRDARWNSLLICGRVVLLNVLHVLVFIHDHEGRHIAMRYLLCIQIGPRIPSCFWSPVCWIGVTRSRTNVRANKFHGSSTALAADEILHERIASLLTTAGLGVRILVHALFVKYSLFPAIFQIFRCCALETDF